MRSASTVFVDTNILLYAQDPRDPGKQVAVAGWLARCWRDGSGPLSTQVLHEMYVNLLRLAPRLGVQAVRAPVARCRAWRPWVVDDATVDLAWQLQERHAFHDWDALSVAAAQQQGCRWLLGEDLQHGQRVDELRVVNPFVAGPELLDAPAP